MKQYELRIEVAGPLAMFCRPDTGSAPISYPAPTWSAAKGIFESIAFLLDGRAWICPKAVQICRRIGEQRGRVQFQRYATNYGGPMRKSDLFRKGLTSGGSSMQLHATVLNDVCYRMYADVMGAFAPGHVNPRHHLKELFERRLRQGRCFRTPCLGWSEFTCAYWGPFRDGITEVDDALSLDVPSMLLAVWDTPTGGEYAPTFVQGQRNQQGDPAMPLRIDGGTLKYDVPGEWLQEHRKDSSCAQ